MATLNPQWMRRNVEIDEVHRDDAMHLCRAWEITMHVL
jgi:hypothetical protein